MEIKLFMTSFIFTSLIFSLLFFPSLKHSTTTANLNNLHQKNSNYSYPVTFAYLISASKNDTNRLKRVLTALYHPANYYLIHMDREAEPEEYSEVYEFVSNISVFSEVGNVLIIKKSNLVSYRGPTMLSTTLHGISVLLRCFKWDWFINLSAADYPLITQDDLIYAFSDLPRDLNFVQHSSHLGWKINKRARPMIIDPALYSLNKSELIWLSKQRTLPTAFKLYTGSAWTVLSRSFAEYCIVGWESLPRTLLLYFTNFISSPEFYFQTLICNSGDQLRRTVVNHDLHYVAWDNPPKQHPLSLSLKHYRRMILSNAPFARKFKQDDPVLNKIDKQLLHRRSSSTVRENVGALRPGPGARRLKALLNKMLLPKNMKRHCR